MNKIFVKTFGCTLNQKTTEELTSNSTSVKDIKDADYIFINTCGVKEQTEFKIISYLNNLKKNQIPENKIILFGCLVDIDSSKLKKNNPNSIYLGLKDESKLKKIINTTKIIQKKNKTTETIIIANGCLGSCSYCAVKFARGKLKSKSIKEIKKEVEVAIENGAKEILLTAQDTGCYGFDINTNIISLLKELFKINGEFRIRLGMANPQHLIKFYKELSELYNNPKLYTFLHIPIQAGDDVVLKKMNRFYTTKEPKIIIDYLRKKHPRITIATDIIVGFPEETDKEFNNTINYIKEIKPSIVNISRFGTRKGIEANLLKEVSGQIKKERSRIASKVAREIVIKNNVIFVGQECKILLNEVRDNYTIAGKTQEYLPVVIKKTKKTKIGDFANVVITSQKEYYLFGKIKNN